MTTFVEESEVLLSPSEVQLTCTEAKEGNIYYNDKSLCDENKSNSITRLVIRDIDVENFKSYYGHHRIGPFHKTFTAVIGPNGSGKSNVIDALLFVFGRNAKKIRLDKLSELIHNSAAHPNLTYASVTVNFVRISEPADPKSKFGCKMTNNVRKDSKNNNENNGLLNNDAESEFYKFVEQREEIANSELSITREVYRSGTSQYFIDGLRKSQKDVIACLIGQGVDLEHNRFLILQGEVEQIALMKPKAEKEGEEGLLEYLDDLIGTNDMIDAISASSKLAESAQLERMQTLDAEQKLKNEREALDAAKNSALAFVTKDNHLQKTLIVMCQLRMRGIEERLVEPRRLLQEIDNRIVAYKNEVENRTAAKAAAEEEISKTKKEVYEVTKERDLARNKKLNCETELEHLKSGVDEQDRARRKIGENLKRAKDNMQRALLQQQDAERESLIHQQNYEEQTQAAQELRTQYEALSATLLPQLKPLRQKLEEKKRSFAPYERAVTESTEKLNTARNKLDALDSALHKRAEQVDVMESNLQTRTQRLRELVEHLQHAEHNNTHERLAQMQNALAEVTRRKFAINTIIQEKKSSYSEGETEDRAMEFLLSQRSLKGYYGTLRQLGKIEECYDVAAGMASNAWSFHVVQDKSTAVAALNLLKQHNLGRATMMVMSEIEREVGARAAKPFTCPNMKAKRLFDLIQPTHEKFKNVFYQAVRNTLVVSNLTEARETAFNTNHNNNNNKSNNNSNERFRVVTLKGELVEPSGMITGGGSAPRGAKLKAARAPIDKIALRGELEKLQKELIETAEQERQLQFDIHQLQEQANQFSPQVVKQLRHEHRNLTAAMENDRAQLTELQEEYQELQSTSQTTRSELLLHIASCERELAEAEEAKSKHHSAIAQLELQLASVGGEQYRLLGENLKATNVKVDAEEEALRTCRRNAQKYRAMFERKSEDVSQYERELALAQAEAAEGAKPEIAQCTSRLEDATRQLHVIEDKLAKAQTSYEDARAALPIAHAALVEAQKKLDDENRYRQTESSKMADALQELAKFEQKIEGCEQKIRENVELYGVETLQLEIRTTSDNEDEEEDDDFMSHDEEEEEQERQEYEQEEEEEEEEEEEIADDTNNHRQDKVKEFQEEEEEEEEEYEKEVENEREETLHGNVSKEVNNIRANKIRHGKRSRHKRQNDKEHQGSKSKKGKRESIELKEKEELDNDEENKLYEEQKDEGEGEDEEEVRTSTDTSNRSSGNNNNNHNHNSTRSSNSNLSHNENSVSEAEHSNTFNNNDNKHVRHVRRRHARRHKNELTLETIRHMSFKVTAAELDECDYGRSVHLATALSEETKRLHSEIDFRAIALWRERDVAHRAARALYEEKKQIADHAETTLFELKERRRMAFMAVFNHIRVQLKEVYQLLTHGGDADMELVDVNDPFEGINFVVRPPKKSWKQISNLSGGEKTLSSLALIFALHHIKPTPIYVMDEIDAALDFRNVSIVANYVLRQASGAQFIIISLRNNMFEMAHQLVGVCKVNDVTSTLVLMPRAFQRKVEQMIRASQPSPARLSHSNEKAHKRENQVEIEENAKTTENSTNDERTELIQRFSHQISEINTNVDSTNNNSDNNNSNHNNNNVNLTDLENGQTLETAPTSTSKKVEYNMRNSSNDVVCQQFVSNSNTNSNNNNYNNNSNSNDDIDNSDKENRRII